jgi:predicted ABC-type transport system involved in lysophospholipase L1 biosynthesis ATPase subunit
MLVTHDPALAARARRVIRLVAGTIVANARNDEP